ncbi:hypothetical protein BJX61DRAFT_499537 [Aspergillus egyptiacus]|nr:hypothetical protein BJX61DRAFT_499537 [Aspergillus egyptiacus]
MTWSIESILAFLTMLITVPTSILGIWTLVKQWRRGRQLYSPLRGTPGPHVMPTLSGPDRLQLVPAPPLQNPSPSPLPYIDNPHSLAEAGFLPYYYVMRFGTVEIRGPVPQSRS